MRYLLFISLFIFTNTINSQEKDINFIIEIDNEIDIAISNIDLIVKFRMDSEKTYPMGYIPGQMTLNQNDYKKIKSDDIDYLKVRFTWNDTRENNKLNYYYYTIDFDISWLDSNFCILSIYNLNNKYNRRIFGKKKNKEKYLYEYTTSESTMLLPRKRKESKGSVLN